MSKKINNQKKLLDKLAAKQGHDSIGSNEPVSAQPHLASFPNASKEEILCEYLSFLKNLPPLLDGEKTKLVTEIRHLLDIDKIIQNLNELDFDKLLHIGKGSSILGKHYIQKLRFNVIRDEF